MITSTNVIKNINTIAQNVSMKAMVNHKQLNSYVSIKLQLKQTLCAIVYKTENNNVSTCQLPYKS